MGVITKLVGLIGILLFVCAFALLSISVSTPLQFVALGILCFLVLVLAVLVARKGQDKKSMYYPHAFHQMGSLCEVNLFDPKGQLLLSTKGPAYLNLSDFARKLFQKVQPSEASAKLQEALETQQYCDVLVSGGGNGLGQFEKWWFQTS
jgi:hypothetical protein